jgi:hypothetical protein
MAASEAPPASESLAETSHGPPRKLSSDPRILRGHERARELGLSALLESVGITRSLSDEQLAAGAEFCDGEGAISMEDITEYGKTEGLLAAMDLKEIPRAKLRKGFYKLGERSQDASVSKGSDRAASNPRVSSEASQDVNPEAVYSDAWTDEFAEQASDKSLDVAADKIAKAVSAAVQGYLASLPAAFASLTQDVQTQSVHFSWGDKRSVRTKARVKFDKETGWFVLVDLKKRDDEQSAGCFICAAKKSTLRMDVQLYGMRAINMAARKECQQLTSYQGQELLKRISGMKLFERQATKRPQRRPTPSGEATSERRSSEGDRSYPSVDMQRL